MENTVNNESLLQDIKSVVSNTENLLKETEGQSGEKIDSIRSKLKANLLATKSKLREMEAAVAQKAKATAKATDVYVHENPWKSIGVAAGVGVIIGLLIGRK